MAIPEFDPTSLVIGTVGRPHGLAGELTLRPHNLGGAALEKVPRLLLERNGAREVHVVDWFRRAGQGWIFRLRDISSRAQAEALTHAPVRVERRWLPPLGEGEFFVEDLLGCAVETESGRPLGQVVNLMWNGAQDIMVIAADEELLIPVVPAFVRSVEVLGRRVIVDWAVDAAEPAPADPTAANPAGEGGARVEAPVARRPGPSGGNASDA